MAGRLFNIWSTREDGNSLYIYIQSLNRIQLLRPMDCSTPGFPVHQQFPEFTQIHDHWVSDATQPSRLLLSPSPPAFNLSQPWVFSNESALRIRWTNYWIFNFSISLPMNTQDWHPLEGTGWMSLQSKGLSRVFSNTTVQSVNSLTLRFLYSPTVARIHDQWKNNSLG